MALESVLLVDDEPDIRRIGQLSLRSVGQLTVWSAAGAEEAIELARTHKPGVILLDVMMRGTDGPTTLALLRADAQTAAIPVVFMTAKVTPEQVAKYVTLGALGVIRKPFDPMTLPADVRALVEGRP